MKGQKISYKDETVYFNVDLTEPDEVYELTGYQESKIKVITGKYSPDLSPKKYLFQRACVFVGYFLTAGMLWLFLHWYQNYKVKMMYRKCSPSSADCLLISNLKFKQHYVVKPVFLPSQIVGKYFNELTFGEKTELVTFNFMERKFLLRFEVSKKF